MKKDKGNNMPQRSNDFQRLVYLIKKHWTEATDIEESKMLEDRITGDIREVDVVITGNVGGHKVVVSLECVDRSRKADITWVEQMKEKHARLPTNTLVLYASSGFTKAAAKLAKISGIEIVTLELIDEGYVTKLMGRSGAFVIVRYRIDPIKVTVVVPELDNLPSEKICLSPTNRIFFRDGTEHPSLRKLVDEFLHSKEVTERIVKEVTEKHTRFSIFKDNFLDVDSNEVYLEKIEPKALRRIEKILVEGACRFNFTRFPLQHANLGENKVSWGNAEIDGNKSMLVVSPLNDETARLVLSFGNKSAIPEPWNQLQK